MRIVMICCDYAPNVGGIAAHIQQLSWALSRRGHHVWVLNHRYGRGEERTWEEHGVRVHQSFLGRENNRIKSTLPSYWYSGRRRVGHRRTAGWSCTFMIFSRALGWRCSRPDATRLSS
jgi:glycogen synthase